MTATKKKTTGKATTGRKKTTHRGHPPTNAVKKKSGPRKQKTPSALTEEQERRAQIRKEESERRAQVYDVELDEGERSMLIMKLEKLGTAREPAETRLLDKLRGLRARGKTPTRRRR